MSALSMFGALAVFSMLTLYALEERARIFVLAFSAASLASAVYAFMQGAWPFGVAEVIWSGVAMRRWQRRARD